MRSLLSLFFLAGFLNVAAQNVGIGTATPSEKLHVEGNINLAGNLKVNDVSGQPGQALMTNSSGSTQWVDVTPYQNYEHLTFGSGTWTVPAGVTKIKVQVWGGGGAGNKDAGGGSGGYITATITVTPGNVLAYETGVGGTGGSTSGSDGGNSLITAAGVTFYAFGGSGATSSGYTIDYGAGGSFAHSSAAFRSWFGINGEAGSSNRIEYFQSSATEFLKSSSGGNGGNSPLVPNSGGKGRAMLINAATEAYLALTKTTAGILPGGGGGGGFVNGGSSGTGGNGARGSILVHY